MNKSPIFAVIAVHLVVFAALQSGIINPGTVLLAPSDGQFSLKKPFARAVGLWRTNAAVEQPSAELLLTATENLYYLPILFTPEKGTAEIDDSVPRINIPYFQGEIRYPETAVFWFGKVNSIDNFADVRLGYNDDTLFVNLSVYDRHLWYNPQPSPGSLTLGDAVSLYLRAGSGVDTVLYRFDAMLSWWEARSNFQSAHRFQEDEWIPSNLAFTTRTGWRGNAPNNNNGDDRGWTVTFLIPFQSLGSSQPPSSGEVWKIGLVLHDQDDSGAALRPEKYWPQKIQSSDPATWGNLHFGVPTFSAPKLPESGQIQIRHNSNGDVVPGAAVGGGTTCGAGLSFWSQWGDTPSSGSEENSIFNVQNQSDVADWPCFSRYYITFPLESIPEGQAILSAKLTLFQMGNSGGNEWGEPAPSFVQIYTVYENWDEKSLTWNNAPLANENVSGAWVNPIKSFPGWPGVPWDWDISAAVQSAYAAGKPLRLAIYTADDQYHSGKYFVSSYTGEWNAHGRPTLTVSWGTP
jgi:hypothetical protein